MLRSIRHRLTFANVMASVAVFIALGGASYAAVALPKNSVGSKQLRTGGVKKSDLGVGSVGTSELRRRSVKSTKLANRAVTKRSLSRWIRGQLRRRAAAGPPGPQGPQGSTGPRGPGAVPFRYSATASATSSPVRLFEAGGLRVSVSCDVGVPGGGPGTTLTFRVRSAQAATLYETVTFDSSDANPAASDNLVLPIPAGVTQTSEGPSVNDGFVYLAVQGVFASPRSMLDLSLFAVITDPAGAGAGSCRVNGVVVPA